MFVRRNLKYPLFDAFDAPDTNTTCPERNVTVNAPQALMLLNSDLVLDQAVRSPAEREQVDRRHAVATSRLGDGDHDAVERRRRRHGGKDGAEPSGCSGALHCLPFAEVNDVKTETS